MCAGKALLVLSVICLASTPSPAVQAPTRILFIGNSLTAANDLPGLVERIARAAGELFECTTVAFPDHGLEEHWSRGDAQRAIRKGGWTFVVLQQGPSALPESRDILRRYARRFDAEVRRTGARTAFYMVWPSTARRTDFDAVSMSVLDGGQRCWCPAPARGRCVAGGVATRPASRALRARRISSERVRFVSRGPCRLSGLDRSTGSHRARRHLDSGRSEDASS